jgi:hypothetical protein
VKKPQSLLNMAILSLPSIERSPDTGRIPTICSFYAA